MNQQGGQKKPHHCKCGATAPSKFSNGRKTKCTKCVNAQARRDPQFASVTPESIEMLRRKWV